MQNEPSSGPMLIARTRIVRPRLPFIVDTGASVSAMRGKEYDQFAPGTYPLEDTHGVTCNEENRRLSIFSLRVPV